LQRDYATEAYISEQLAASEEIEFAPHRPVVDAGVSSVSGVRDGSATDAAPNGTNATNASGGDAAQLLEELASFVRRYVVLTEEQADAVALFVVHTHAFDAATATPYLWITSATPRSGKSRLLDVIELLVAKPLSTVNISDAALFRAIETKHPTLLFDEVDAIFGAKARDREDLRGLLNSGYQAGRPAYRMGGPNRTDLEEFDVFCPKALAGLGDLPDTLADRCVRIRLERKSRSEQVERFRRREVAPEAEVMQLNAAAWADRHVDLLRDARPELPDELDDRAQDVWEPLLAIADLAGGVWPVRARHAAVDLSGGEAREEEHLGVKLLGDIKRVLETRGIDRIKTVELLWALAEIDTSPWGNWYGKTITAHALSRLLKDFRIKTMPVWVDGETVRGYKREQFEDPWTRYLPDGGVSRVSAVRPEAASDATPNGPIAPNASHDEPGDEQQFLADVADLVDRGDARWLSDPADTQGEDEHE